MSGSQHTPICIGFCITDLDVGGAEKAMVQLVLRLDRRFWSPFVICLTDRGALVDELERAGIETICLNATGWRSLLCFRQLVAELRRRRPQLVQTYLFHANLAGRLAAALARIPVVVCGIRVAERRFPSRLWWDRWTQRLVNCHVAVSQAVAEFSVRAGRLPESRVVAIPNGVDAGRLAAVEPLSPAHWGLPDTARMVLFVGRLDIQKDPQLLVEALQEVLQRFPDVHLVLAGDGPLRTVLEVLIAGLPTRDRMHLMGQRSDVPSLLRSATCFVLPSRWEGMANVVLEAMAGGCPIVTTSVEGNTEILEHDRSGLLVPVGDGAAIAAAVTRLLTDQDLARSLAIAARQAVVEGHAWDRTVVQYEVLYRSLLAEAGVVEITEPGPV